VTSGAAAGLTLAAAACLAGLDPARMDRLPDTSGLSNEIVVCREQRNGYDHALRAAGARLVEVGMNEQVAGAYLQIVADGLAELPAVTTRLAGAPDGDRVPVLEVRLDEAHLGLTAFEVDRRLRAGSPPVYVNEGRLHEGVLVLLAVGLDDAGVPALLERLRAVLAG
jgi:hypothetical protein